MLEASFIAGSFGYSAVSKGASEAGDCVSLGPSPTVVFETLQSRSEDLNVIDVNMCPPFEPNVFLPRGA
jgi:hypothetical protein